MDMTEINKLYSMLASEDGEMQNLGIKLMMPKVKIPVCVEAKKNLVNMLKSDLCIKAFELGTEFGREIQQKITGKWQPYYRTTRVDKKE